MPEGDTVWLAAHRMNEALGGQPLVHWDLRVPTLATTDLRGETLLEVVARGKHMLTRVSGGWSLHTHFRMEGSWHLYPHGRPWRGGPMSQVRAVLGTATLDAVGYRLAVVELLRTSQEAAAVGHLGPDVLGPDWDVATAAGNLRREPAAEIGMALLDQRNLAGLGNLYRTELCFLRGVNPWTPVAQVADLEGLLELGQRLIRRNRDHWSQATTGSTRRGEEHWVFERAGRPCRRCGTPVRQQWQGPAAVRRVTYWCPHCQPPPGR